MIAADLFCGAGGTSTGLLLAAAERNVSVRLLAINHWRLAIETHLLNHPDVFHLCESLDHIDPTEVVPGGRLQILCASPECTHFSRARGGKPRSDQSRASAWKVVDWVNKLHVENLLIENVAEFADWGPLRKDGKPMKSRKGATFNAFLTALDASGFHIEWRIVNCADYGDPTTRKRLFIMGCRDRKPRWPAPTHAGHWRAAREVIDWNLKGESIFERKRPLSANTMRRIVAGLRKFGGSAFVVSWDQQSGTGLRSADAPLTTLTTKARHGVVEPFLVNLRGTEDSHISTSARSIDQPVPTLTAAGEHVALVEPFLIGQQSCAAARPVSQPVPTVATSGAIALVEPFLLKYYGTSVEAQSIREPLATVTTRDRFGLCQPECTVAGKRYVLDIRFRMLQPHELSAAMSFPNSYKFSGNREDQVKQIGNAVPVNTARALCGALLDGITADKPRQTPTPAAFGRPSGVSRQSFSLNS